MAARSLTRYKSCSDEESSSVSGPTHHHRQLRAASSSRSASRDLGHESGFQSVASLESSVYESPLSISGLPSSYVDNTAGLGLGRASSDSLASLTSGISSFHLVPGAGAASCSPLPGPRRHSLTRLGPGDRVAGSRVSLGGSRRSARSFVPSKEAPGVQFAQYRPAQWFLKPIFHEVPQREAAGGAVFVGRKWVWQQMADTLGQGRGVVIVGGPGTGKTALSLQLVQHSCFGPSKPAAAGSGDQLQLLAGQLAAYHFCQLDSVVTCRVADWLHSTAAQLSQAPQLTAYHQLLSTQHQLRAQLSLASCQADPDTALTAGILQPLEQLRAAGKIAAESCILLLDAIGDSHSHRPDFGDTLISFLARHLASFPAWLKLVVTVRAEKQELVSTFGLSQVSLDQWQIDKRIEADITEFVSRRISRSPSIQRNITPQLGRHTEDNPQVKFQNYLVSIAKGCFLFVKLVLDLVDRGHLVIKSSSFKILPQTLSEVFMLEFNLRFPSAASFRRVSDLLAVVVAALQPMTLAELHHTLASLYLDTSLGGDTSWPSFLDTYQQLAGQLVTRRDDSVMMFHPALRDWLVRRPEGESTKFLVDPRTGHAAIALRMSRLEAPVNDEVTLELCHHILKAHLYRASASSLQARDLQSAWISAASDDPSLALAHTSNLHSPNINVSRLLLLSGASPDVNTDLASPAPILCVFAGRGYTEMVSLLLQFGADISIRDAGGSTALCLAAARGHLDTVRLLVESGAVLGSVTRAGHCALVLAASRGHFPVVEHLAASDWPAAELGEACQQAAVAASYHGHTSILEFLLDMAEVKVDSVDTLMLETPLCAAAAAGQLASCEVVVRRGGTVTASNLAGVAPLQLAAKEGHYAVCEQLLAQGAELELAGGGGRTPLLEAATQGHTGLVELLLVRGARLEARDQEGATALLLAAARARLDTAKCLLGRGADLSHVDTKGRSALDLAARHGDPATVQLLLEAGAVMERADLAGMRPLDTAVSCGHVEAVKCFLRRGAKLGPATWSLAAARPQLLLTLLNKLLEDGNTLFKRNKLAEAGQRYQYAAKRVPQGPGLGGHQAVFTQLRVHLLLNLARVRRRTGDLQEAASLATQVLEVAGPGCYQGLHARAKAHHAAGDLELAVADLTAAVRAAPENRELQRILISVKAELVTRGGSCGDNKSDKSHDSSSGVSSTTDNTLQNIV